MESFIIHFFDSFSLEDVIICIVAGFVCLWMFNFTIEADYDLTNQKNIILDFLIGFILKNICRIIPFRTRSHPLNIAIFVCVCIFLGYITGLLYQSKFVAKILSFLKIRSIPQQYIWSVITKQESSLWVRIGYKELNIKYFGLVQYCENQQRYPQIVLYGYTKGTYDQDLIQDFCEDYTGDMSKFVLLDTAKADFVEFVSTSKS